MSQKGDEIRIKSVGVDVGSSTSHLIFSELVLTRNLKSPTRRYEVTDRKILYASPIYETPLKDPTTIDMDKLSEILKSEYESAKISPNAVDTGAVIVTGETAKKENAAEIVELIAQDAGKFVAATAGPNFESMLAAFGSGMTQLSQDDHKTILTVDIGGGTSNLAISKEGQVVSTACISVGGRLLAVENNKIWRIDAPTRQVMNYLGISFQVEDEISEQDILNIAKTFAEVLVEVISGPALSPLSKQLMMTTDLDFSYKIDAIAFTGGVGELIYSKNNNRSYRDIGHILAKEILNFQEKFIAPMIEPENKIRATVIGAGSYSLSISGSTCYHDQNIEFPLRNIPVIFVDATRELLSIEHIATEISKSFERFDLQEGENVVALYFKDPVRGTYNQLKLFAHALSEALPNSCINKTPIILIFERDIANSVGNVIRREAVLPSKLMALDELDLKEGDWIDIGSPLVNGNVFPVTVKSLVFARDE